jgi:hypothetical protein
MYEPLSLVTLTPSEEELLLTFSPEPMDDQSGPTSMDLTLESLVPVILLDEEFPDLNSTDEIAKWLSVNSTKCSDEEELPELNSLEEVTQWLDVDCPSA